MLVAMNRVRGTSHVLVVDDEENIRFLLDSALTHFGFEVETAESGRAALKRIADAPPDLVILDVMLPDLDGFEVVRRLRADGIRTPILFLTARDSTDDAVHGLTLGGDDYVTKPFSLEELIARVRSILRRAGDVDDGSVLVYADLEMDEDAHLVKRAGESIDLSPTEYKLLRYLLINSGRVLSRSQILDHVWEYDWDGEASIVETYVSYLRKKVDRVAPPLIKTVRGVGYCLRKE
jgi:two-component system OmpR family response regulator